MKKLLPIVLMLISNISANAQFGGVRDGVPLDSVTFTFSAGDSLTRSMAHIDTIGSGIWKIGSTSKPFFSATPISNFAIMTDTLLPYDTSINSSFKVILNAYNFNTILSFRHKYQTRAGMDGGIVEYSIDTGKSWANVLGSCNSDSLGLWQGILTTNFYKKTDTLKNGEQAFSGSSNGWQYSRVQVFVGLPIKSTGTTNCVSSAQIQFRFRFYGDNKPDTLDGWIIDDLKVEHDDYGGGVATGVNSLPVKVYPNPTNGIFHIAMPEMYFTKASIINTIGQTVYATSINSTNQTINVELLPAGIYQLVLQGEYGTKTMLINKD